MIKSKSSVYSSAPQYTFESVMLELRRSEFPFTLTGSRHFGHGVDFDWDFFAMDSPDIRELLSDLGFVKKASYGLGTIRDKYTSCVYERPATKKQDRIHVQLIYPDKYDLKVKAQEFISKHKLDTHISKARGGSRRSVWDLVHDYLEEHDDARRRLTEVLELRDDLHHYISEADELAVALSKISRRYDRFKLSTFVVHAAALVYFYLPPEVISSAVEVLSPVVKIVMQYVS